MKEIKILIVEIVVGAIMAGIGFTINIDYYSGLLFAGGFAFSFSAFVQILRLMYWNSPKHKQEYEARKREAHIDSIDERKQFLRAKAGLVTCQVTIILLFILEFILVLLHVEAWIIGLVFSLLIFQWIVWAVVFHTLEKRM